MKWSLYHTYYKPNEYENNISQYITDNHVSETSSGLEGLENMMFSNTLVTFRHIFSMIRLGPFWMEEFGLNLYRHNLRKAGNIPISTAQIPRHPSQTHGL